MEHVLLVLVCRDTLSIRLVRLANLVLKIVSIALRGTDPVLVVMVVISLIRVLIYVSNVLISAKPARTLRLVLHVSMDTPSMLRRTLVPFPRTQ